MRGGFTLIELMVVIVIVTIMTGFVVLRLDLAGPDALESCAGEVKRWLDGVRDDAVEAGTLHYVVPGQRQLTAYALERDEEGVAARELTALQLPEGCRLALSGPPESDAGRLRGFPAAIRESRLAVTGDGDWLSRQASAGLTLLGEGGKRRGIALHSDFPEGQGGS